MRVFAERDFRVAPGWYALALRHRRPSSVSVPPMWGAAQHRVARRAIVVDGRGVAGFDDALVPRRAEFVVAEILRELGLRAWVPAAAEPGARVGGRRGRAKAVVWQPILTGYVLTELRGDADWHLVAMSPLVAGVVAIGGVPARFGHRALLQLGRCELRVRRRWHPRGDLRPLPFGVDDVVEVIDGPFEGFKVPVLSIEGKSVARVLCTLFGRENEAEIEVEKLRALA